MLTVEELNKLNEEANRVNALKSFVEGIISSECLLLNLSYYDDGKRYVMSLAARDLLPHMQEFLSRKLIELSGKGVKI